MKFQRGEIIGGVTIGTARDNWRKHVGTACTDLRMNCIPPRPQIRYENALALAAVSEILSLRLQAAYIPIFGTLQKIEQKIAVLASLRAELWAPANHEVNRR